MHTELADLLAEAESAMNAQEISVGMDLCTKGLNSLRGQGWREALEVHASTPTMTSLRSVLHECPYTRRGFARPRGYSGDAVLIDYIYGMAALPEDTTKRGRDIYTWCRESSAAFRAVEERRRLAASWIDACAERAGSPKILSVASGHVREAAHSRAVVNGEIGCLVALDHDPETLRVVANATTGLRVRPVCKSIGRLLKGEFEENGFDLIYACGVFDYLDTRTAIALIADLVQRLDTNGRLIVGNFTEIWESAYMEAFMDWWLIYRTPNDLLDLVESAAPSCSVRTFATNNGNIVFAEIERG